MRIIMLLPLLSIWLAFCFVITSDFCITCFAFFHSFRIIRLGLICLPRGQQLTQHHFALCAFTGSLPCHVTATSSAGTTREQFILYQPARHLAMHLDFSRDTLLSVTKK